MMENIELKRGEYANYTLYIRRAGALIDISNWVIRLVARDDGIPAGTTSNDTDAVLVKSTGSGISIAADQVTNIGEAYIEFLQADTNSVEFTPTRRMVEWPFGIEAIPDGYPSSVPVGEAIIIITPDYPRAI